jgi:hypothetical protein
MIEPKPWDPSSSLPHHKMKLKIEIEIETEMEMETEIKMYIKREMTPSGVKG